MLLTWPIRARFSTPSGGRPCVQQTTRLKTLDHCPGAPQLQGWGNAAEGSGSPSTSDNIENLARAPDFQHGLEGTNETPNRLKKLSIKSRRLPSHETRCNATERLGALQHQTMLLIWHGARFSTLSGDKLTYSGTTTMMPSRLFLF